MIQYPDSFYLITSCKSTFSDFQNFFSFIFLRNTDFFFIHALLHTISIDFRDIFILQSFCTFVFCFISCQIFLFAISICNLCSICIFFHICKSWHCVLRQFTVFHPEQRRFRILYTFCSPIRKICCIHWYTGCHYCACKK